MIWMWGEPGPTIQWSRSALSDQQQHQEIAHGNFPTHQVPRMNSARLMPTPLLGRELDDGVPLWFCASCLVSGLAELCVRRCLYTSTALLLGRCGRVLQAEH